MINVQFAALPERWETYEAPLRAAFEKFDLTVDLRLDHAPQDVDYIGYAPNSDLQDFTAFMHCKRS